MDPSTVEMSLMLRVNKHLWTGGALQNIVDKNKAAARDAAIERSKRKRTEDNVVNDSEGDFETV